MAGVTGRVSCIRPARDVHGRNRGPLFLSAALPAPDVETFRLQVASGDDGFLCLM